MQADAKTEPVAAMRCLGPDERSRDAGDLGRTTEEVDEDCKSREAGSRQFDRKGGGSHAWGESGRES